MNAQPQSTTVVIETVHGLKQEIFIEPLSPEQRLFPATQSLSAAAASTAKGKRGQNGLGRKQQGVGRGVGSPAAGPIRRSFPQRKKAL